MRIKYFISISILVCTFLIASGQTEEAKAKLKLRHIKGIRGFDLGGGVTKFGNYYQVSYIRFLEDRYFVKPSFSYEAGKIGLTKYSEYSLFVSFQKCFVKYKDFMFINGGLSPVFQMQITNNSVLEKSDTFYPFGVSLDINVELFLFNKLALFGSVNEIFTPNDKFGNLRYLLGGGIKIYLN